MMHTGWMNLLLKNGYEVVHRPHDSGAMIVVVKDGMDVLGLPLSFGGRGNVHPSSVHAELCFRLQLAERKSYCPEGPVELETTKAGRGETIHKHPSFGVMRMNRYSGGNKHFMSPIETGGGISIEIHSAELHDSELGTQHAYQKNMILEADMSFTQFAELISGGGTQVPITLKYVNNCSVDGVPDMPTTQERLSNHLQATLQEATNNILEIIQKYDAELKAPGTLGAKRKQEIWDELKSALSKINSTPAWIMHLWDEGANEITKHVKGELLAWFQNAVTDEKSTYATIFEVMNTRSLEAKLQQDEKDAS